MSKEEIKKTKTTKSASKAKAIPKKKTGTKTLTKKSTKTKITTVKTPAKAPKVKSPIKKTITKKGSAPLSHGVGRRKSAVARVWLRKGEGLLTVNDNDYTKYFDTDLSRYKAYKVFNLIPDAVKYDFQVSVDGGGLCAQADAVQLGIARALLAKDKDLKKSLRENGFLTVDARIKERKKYGQRGARRKFQFVKR